MNTTVAIDCSHRPPCPGCPRFGEPGLALAAHGALARMAQRAGLACPTVSTGERLGFRRRVRLMVRGRPGAPKLGIFQAASHRIVDIPRCRIHHPLVNEVAYAVRDALRRTGIAPYADAPHRGEIRALQVTVERGGDRAQVVLVGNASEPAPLAPLVEPLRTALGERLQGLWWNGNPERTNVILGRRWRHLAGEAVLRESVAGVEVCFPPGAFVQSHARLAERVVERARAAVAPGATVAEFYAGCGPIGLGLLATAREVRFNEIDRHGIEGLERLFDPAPEALAPAPVSTARHELRLDLDSRGGRAGRPEETTADVPDDHDLVAGVEVLDPRRRLQHCDRDRDGPAVEAGRHLQLHEHFFRRQHPDFGRARTGTGDDGEIERCFDGVHENSLVW